MHDAGNHSSLNDLDITIPLEATPKLIFASRTHSQVSQGNFRNFRNFNTHSEHFDFLSALAMKELKRTAYKDYKSAVIASRDQLCCNPEVKIIQSNEAKTNKCRSLRKNDKCQYYLNLNAGLKEPDFQAPIIDIEDLGRLGKKFQCCSYFASQKQVEGAEVIFMPYNYLLDLKIRSANKIDLRNSIVILDEAHNVEKMCEDSASITIKTTDITTAISDTKYVISTHFS